MRISHPATSHRPHRTRRLLAGLAATLLALTALVGCGSDGDDTNENEDAAETEVFCDAIADYAEKAESGDKVAMADTLNGLDGELGDPERRIVEAHITALTTASGNHPGGDRELREQTEASLRELAEKNCGEGSLPEFDRSGDVDDDNAPDTGDGDTDTDGDMGDDDTNTDGGMDNGAAGETDG